MSSPDPVSSGWAPNGVVAASGFSVACVGVLVWVLKAAAGITVPPEQLPNLCIIAAGIGAYLHPAGRGPKA